MKKRQSENSISMDEMTLTRDVGDKQIDITVEHSHISWCIEWYQNHIPAAKYQHVK